MRRRFLITHALLCAAVAATPMAFAQAQNWPNKPVKLILPYPPGGNVDGAARIISEQLQQKLGQPFIIDNRPGAGGLIAGEAVAKSAPDGYTFFMGANGPILFSPLIFKRDVYNWKKDFVPVSTVSFTPLVLQVHPSVPYKTLGELLAAAKQHPDTITMASAGAGTSNHLLSEYLQRESGVRWITAHYKGNAPATTDLLSGQVQFNFDQLSVAQQFLKTGRTRALVVTSPKRLPQLPDVPTLSESGFAGLSAETFTGLLAPKDTPAAIVNKLSETLRQILSDKSVQERYLALGSEARPSTPEQFSQYLSQEDKRWTPIIKELNITAN